MLLHATEWGDPVGRPVVCLHGVLAHGGRFRKLAEERLGRYRVVALDLRGHTILVHRSQLDVQVDPIKARTR